MEEGSGAVALEVVVISGAEVLWVVALAEEASEVEAPGVAVALEANSAVEG